ncbi:MAG: cysteine--tRNA ligase, partial [Sphingobium sp.]
WWMHNNFLVDRGGKISKSRGGFTTLFSLVDAGVHPLAYRLLCLSAHYRSELEFSGEIVATALTRLKRLVMAVEALRAAAGEPAGDLDAVHPRLCEELAGFDAALRDDLNTVKALTHLESAVAMKKVPVPDKLAVALKMDEALGLKLATITRADLRVRPKDAVIGEAEIEAELDRRQQARADRDFATSDAIRDALAARGVEVMDGDPLRWEWRVALEG